MSGIPAHDSFTSFSESLLAKPVASSQLVICQPPSLERIHHGLYTAIVSFTILVAEMALVRGVEAAPNIGGVVLGGSGSCWQLRMFIPITMAPWSWQD